jgi:hypothetical protein
MTRTSMLAAVLAVALAGCTGMVTVGPAQTIKVGKTTLTVSGLEGYNSLAVQTPNPNGPNVFVIDNNIIVDQEPIRPVAIQRRVTIVWRLDADQKSTYSFPDDDAIKLQGTLSNPLPSELDCGAVGDKKKAFICTYIKPDAPREWKYKIRLKNASGQDPTPLDPWIYQP